MTENRTTELLPCPFCGGNARLTTWTPTAASISCIMCGAHFNTYTEAEAIAAWNTRAYLNPDGLPMGLTISDDGNLLNWRGENYVKQGTLGNGTLTAEQVEKAIRDCSTYASYDGCTYYASGIRLQAIADELNAKLGSGTCRLHYGEDDDGYDGWYCDECSGWFQAVRRDGHLVEPKHCQECGEKVVGK